MVSTKAEELQQMKTELSATKASAEEKTGKHSTYMLNAVLCGCVNMCVGGLHMVSVCDGLEHGLCV
jgi:hypothetical protein